MMVTVFEDSPALRNNPSETFSSSSKSAKPTQGGRGFLAFSWAPVLGRRAPLMEPLTRIVWPTGGSRRNICVLRSGIVTIL